MADHIYGSGSWDEVTKKSGSAVHTYQRLRVYVGDKKTKTFYGKTKAEAMRKYKAWKGRSGDPTQKSTLTVVEIAREALESRKDTIKETTYKFYAWGIESLAGEPIGRLQLQAVTSDDLQRYINGLKDTASMSKIKRQRFVLKITFDYAESIGVISESPMNSVKLPNKANVIKQERPPVFLSVDQRKELEAEALSNRKNPKTGKMIYDEVLANAIVFLLHTGLRIGELRALKWDKVDLDKGYIYIRDNAPTGSNKVTIPKRDSSVRKVPLDKTGRAVLDSLEHRSEFVFSTKNGTMVSENNAIRCLKKLLGNSGLERRGIVPTLHDLRHTYASELISKGADVKTVSQILGHKDVSITLNIYVHPSEDSYDKVRGLID